MSPVVIKQPSLDIIVREQPSPDITIKTPGPPGASITGPAGPPAENWTSSVPLEMANGVRVTFTTATPYAPGGLVVWLNGIRETHFVETTPTTFTFSEAPFTGDEVTLLYQTS